MSLTCFKNLPAFHLRMARISCTRFLDANLHATLDFVLFVNVWVYDLNCWFNFILKQSFISGLLINLFKRPSTHFFIRPSFGWDKTSVVLVQHFNFSCSLVLVRGRKFIQVLVQFECQSEVIFQFQFSYSTMLKKTFGLVQFQCKLEILLEFSFSTGKNYSLSFT